MNDLNRLLKEIDGLTGSCKPILSTFVFVFLNTLVSISMFFLRFSIVFDRGGGPGLREVFN